MAEQSKTLVIPVILDESKAQEQFKKFQNSNADLKIHVDTKELAAAFKEIQSLLDSTQKQLGGIDFSKVFGNGKRAFKDGVKDINSMQVNLDKAVNYIGGLRKNLDIVTQQTGKDDKGDPLYALKVTGDDLVSIRENVKALSSATAAIGKGLNTEAFTNLQFILDDIRNTMRDIAGIDLAPSADINEKLQAAEKMFEYKKQVTEMVDGKEQTIEKTRLGKLGKIERDFEKSRKYLTGNTASTLAKKAYEQKTLSPEALNNQGKTVVNEGLLKNMERYTQLGGELAALRIKNPFEITDADGVKKTIQNYQQLYDLLMNIKAAGVDKIQSNLDTNAALVKQKEDTPIQQAQKGREEIAKLKRDYNTALKREGPQGGNKGGSVLDDAGVKQFVDSMTEAINKLNEAQQKVTELQTKLSEAIHVDKPLEIPVEPKTDDVGNFVSKIQSGLEGQSVKIGVEIDTSNIINSSSLTNNELDKIIPFSKDLKDIDVSYLSGVNFDKAEENQLYAIYTQRVKNAYEAFGVKNYKKDNIDTLRTKKLQPIDTPENQEIMNLFSKRDNTFTQEDLRYAEKYNVSLESALKNLNKFQELYHSDYLLKDEDTRSAMLYLQQALLQTEAMGKSSSWLGTKMKRDYGITDGLKGIRSKIEANWKPDDQSVKTLNILKSGVTFDKSLLEQFNKIGGELYAKDVNNSSIEVQVVPTGLDTFRSSIEAAVQSKPIDVGIKIDPNQLDTSGLSIGANGININIGSMGGANNPIQANAISGIAKRDAIKELTKQRDAIEQEFQKQYRPIDAKMSSIGDFFSTPEGAVMTASAKYKDAWSLGQLRYDTEDKSSSLARRMESLTEYINFMKEVAKVKNIDLSGVLSQFKDADKIVEDTNNIITGKIGNDLAQNINNAVNSSDNKTNVTATPKAEDTSSFVSDIQSQISGQKVEVGFKPLQTDADSFISSIQNSLTGKQVELTIKGVKDESSEPKEGEGKEGKKSETSTGKSKDVGDRPENLDKKGKGEGEGRGNAYRGMTKDIFLQNYDLSKYNDVFQDAGLGNFKKLISFGEDGDAVLSFNEGLAETIVRFEDLTEVAGKLKEGNFGLEDFKNSYTQVDQDYVKEAERQEREREKQREAAKKAAEQERKNQIRADLQTSQRIDKSGEDLALKDYETALRMQTQGAKLTDEQANTLSVVQKRLESIGNLDYVGAKDDDLLKYYERYDTASEKIAKEALSKAQKDVTAMGSDQSIAGYDAKVQEIQGHVQELSTAISTIDWVDPKAPQQIGEIVSKLKEAQAELKQMKTDATKQVAQEKPETNRIARETERQNKADQKQAEKEKAEQLKVTQRSEIGKQLEGKSIEGFGDFKGLVTDGKGSSTLTFIDQIGEKVVQTTVKIRDMEAALKAIQGGTFGQYVKDLADTTKNDVVSKTVNPTKEQRDMLKNARSAMVAEYDPYKTLTPVQAGALSGVEAEYQRIIELGHEATAADQAFKAQYESLPSQAMGDYIAQQTNQLNQMYGKTGMTDEYTERLNQIREIINSLNSTTLDPNDKKQISDLKQLHTLYEQLRQDMAAGNLTLASDTSIKQLQDRLATIKVFNSKAVNSKDFKNDFATLENKIGNLGNGQDTKAYVNDLNNQLTDLKTRFNDAGKTGMSFFDTWKQRMGSLGAYLASFASFYRIIRVIKQTIQVVREFDTALTEMRKVSDESMQSLQNFQKASFDMADSIGSNALQVQKSTADFLRLGESFDEAQHSAMTANVLMNVSEFDNIDEATESLISMGSAYNDLDKMDIVDKLNLIGCPKRAKTYRNIRDIYIQ